MNIDEIYLQVGLARQVLCLCLSTTQILAQLLMQTVRLILGDNSKKIFNQIVS